MFTDNTLSNIGLLPQELIDIIWDKIEPKYKVFVSKNYYIMYHSLITIPKYRYTTYLRNIIRNDCDFVVSQLLKENDNRWVKMNNIKYKNSVYASYLHYILALCIEYNASRSRTIIEEYSKLGLGKNRPKRNRHKNIKWTN